MYKILVLIFAASWVFIKQAAAQSSILKKNIIKGYYGIGNNAQKLKAGKTIIPVYASDKKVNEPAKGYYTIGNNKNKIMRPLILPLSHKKAQVTKGYYGIGANAQKLQ